MIQKLIEKLNNRQDDDYVCRYEKLSACCDRISG